MTGYRILSMDDHVFEPQDLWTSRVDSEFKERAPHVARADDGDDWWFCDGAQICFCGGGTQAGVRYEEPEKLSYSDKYENALPGGNNPAERIKDMGTDGVELSVLYPTCGLTLYTVSDTLLVNALMQAYNNWLAEFCSYNPGRLKGIGLLNIDDVQWAVKELERCQKLGFIGATIPSYVDPVKPYQSPDYDPIWASAQDLGMPLSLHLSTNRAGAFNEQFADLSNSLGVDMVVNMDYWVRLSLTQLIMGGVFEKYPGLHVGSIEHEVAWAPYLLERMDYTYTQRPKLDHWIRFKDDTLPSDYFRRNVFLGFQDDAAGIQFRHLIGVDTLQWGSDYPHFEGTFPRSRQVLEELLAECTDEEKAKIAGGNGARVYDLN